MDIAQLQRAIGASADGKWGPQSKEALLKHFTVAGPTAALSGEIAKIAERLGCKLRQLAAVGAVESSGGGFDAKGRVKILFERHYFHRLTDGEWSPAPYSDAKAGGYDEGSWGKLQEACAHDPDAAFASASWGRFQVMGSHWKDLGYASAFDLADTLRSGEAAHYELLARFIEHNKLQDELRACSSNPDDCRAFARAYNGPRYEVNSYHTKLARALI
jgi:hypothetical protein